MLENHRKSPIASEASYVNFGISEACGQTVLPERTILIGQKLVENVKIEHFQCDH